MTGTPTRFLAREKELDVLRRRVSDAVAGRGALLTLSGPPGVGTTRLAREAADRAGAAGMSVAWGECRAGLLDRPFGALAEAIENAALTMPRDQVLADLGTDAGPLLRICPGLAAALPTLVPAVPLEPVDERLRLGEALFGWLTRMAARTPLLVVLDEYQLADADVRAMVDYLARRLRGAPVLLLCVSSIVVKKARATKPAGVLDQIALEGLDLGATAALIGAMSDRPIMPATVDVIQAVGHGNPLLSVELYRHMVEESLLPGPGGAATLPPPTALPQSIDQVVAWRAARLPTANRAAFNVLAAFPGGAAPHVVATIAGVIKGRAVEALDGLVADGLARVNGDGTRYEIVHPQIRTALLGAMAPHLRAQLHRRVAEVLEAEAGNERRQMATELAHYWFESRSIPGRERGLGHFLLATEQARAAYAHNRAVNCLRAALDVAPQDNATRLDLTGRLALAEAAAGLRKDALASASRALELGGAGTPAHAADRASPSAEALAAVTDTLRTLADGIDADQASALDALREAALERLGADRSARSDSLPHARLSLLAETWQELDFDGVGVLAWADLQPQAAAVLSTQGTEADKAELMVLQRPRTRVETAAAAEAARAWRRPAATLRALGATASDLIGRLGMFDEGQGWASQYLATAERYGSVRDRVRALALLARCHSTRGEFAAARERIEQAEGILPGLAGAPSPSAEMLADEVTISRFAIDYFLDADWRATSKAVAAPKKPRPAGLLIGALRCIALKRSGKPAEAGALLERLLPAVTEVPPLTLYRDAALRATLTALWEIGAAEHAPTGLTLLGLARSVGVGGQVDASIDLTEARLLGMAGRLAESRAAFAAARSSATATGSLPQVALIGYDEAVILAAAGPRYYGEALNLLSAAGERFERMGMRGWSDRVSALTLFNFKEASAPGGRLFFTYPRGLSRREADVVRLSAAGARPSEVAAELEMDRNDVEGALTSALKKLRGKSLDELPQLARRHGLGGL
jgi:DNA-binding CsgD family transcriptional regulator